MPDERLPQVGSGGFEGLKQVNDYGAEYWCARDLQPLLGYSQWRRFENAIRKAITSCEQSGNEPSHHFASAGKMVGIGSEASREVPDYHLSRFACYLIAQNGDPRKPEIANAQKYFAIQTRRQELSDLAPPTSNGSRFGGRPPKSSKHCRAPRAKPGSKAAC